MIFNNYVLKAVRTSKFQNVFFDPYHSHRKEQVDNSHKYFIEKSILGRATMAKLGLRGEQGEILEIIKKSTFHDKPFVAENFYKEVGDFMWYLADFCHFIFYAPSNKGISCPFLTFNVKNPPGNYLEEEIKEKRWFTLDEKDSKLATLVNLLSEITEFIDKSWNRIYRWTDFNSEVMPVLHQELPKQIGLFIYGCNDTVGLPLENILASNLNKLAERYPGGFKAWEEQK